MESKVFWMVLFVLDFLPWIVKAGHGMTISPSRFTWLESLSYCKLASENSIQYLIDGQYTGWAGGIYLNTQWMRHEGCLKNIGGLNYNGAYALNKLTPALCSEKCRLWPYFALKYMIYNCKLQQPVNTYQEPLIVAVPLLFRTSKKYNWCVCLHSLYNLENVDSSKCTFTCPGSNKDICGERSYFTVYRHITGISKPKYDVDQNLICSVVVPRNDTFLLKAVDCSLQYWTVCVISADTRQMGFTESYQSAISRCSSVNGTILSIFSNLDNLEDGREYWSNIFRSRYLKWTTNESFDEICYEVDGLLNVDCLHLKVTYRRFIYTPMPCKYNNTAICKPKQPGDPAVIRQCKTKKITTASTKEEISTIERPVSSTKHEKEETSTKFTSTTILTSSQESSDTTVLLASTMTNKYPTFSASSMPIKSTKVVASSTPIMATNSILTNSFYTKLVKRSSTKELQFSITTTFKKITTASTKEEISTRERPTSSTKHEKEDTSTKFTSTTILTSSHESTDTTVLLASTITNKYPTFSAPSMPIKSTKVVASSTPSMATNSISTNSFDTKLVKRSSTKELQFSITTTFSIAVLVILVVFVLVCLQVSLIGILRRHWRATQEGNQYELTSLGVSEPIMYAQPEIHHYEVVDDIRS